MQVNRGSFALARWASGVARRIAMLSFVITALRGLACAVEAARGPRPHRHQACPIAIELATKPRTG